MSRQLSYRAREIFSTFLCSKATTPVNIDSQAQLADDILSAPHPDMFKEQQLQVSPCLHCRCRGDSGQARGRGLGSQTASSQVPPGGEGRSRSASWGGRNCLPRLGSGVGCGQPDPGSQGPPAMTIQSHCRVRTPNGRVWGGGEITGTVLLAQGGAEVGLQL